MVWYSVFVIVFSMSKFPWIRSSRVLENVIDTKKCHWYCITVGIPLYIIVYPMTDKSRPHVSSTRSILFHKSVLFYLGSNPYISNIYNIYNQEQNLSLASQKICDHMFSDPKSDHTFRVFWLHTWLILSSFSYGTIFCLLLRQEGVGIHCQLIPK